MGSHFSASNPVFRRLALKLSHCDLSLALLWWFRSDSLIFPSSWMGCAPSSFHTGRRTRRSWVFRGLNNSEREETKGSDNSSSVCMMPRRSSCLHRFNAFKIYFFSFLLYSTWGVQSYLFPLVVFQSINWFTARSAIRLSLLIQRTQITRFG